MKKAVYKNLHLVYAYAGHYEIYYEIEVLGITYQYKVRINFLGYASYTKRTKIRIP